jgi:hypothetical protein
MKVVITALAVCLCLAPPGAGPIASVEASDTFRFLWRDPGPIALRDLYWGAGSAARAPKPPFMFVRENLSGTKPKIDVTDSAGVSWSVKLAEPRPEQNEVHAEIAATRIVWAFGYFVDENYYVPEGRIEGVKGLRRAAEVVGADGAFRVARFERRPENSKVHGEWDLEDNRFNGTRELAGLQALMILLANWDLLAGNAVILRVPLANGDFEEHYLVSDLGSTFGRMRGGVRQSPSRWNIKDYTDTKYVQGIVQARFEFRSPLMGRTPLAIPLTHARWFSSLASQLTDQQIRRAFEASGASPEEIGAFSAQVAKRIADLQASLEK